MVTALSPAGHVLADTGRDAVGLLDDLGTENAQVSLTEARINLILVTIDEDSAPLVQNRLKIQEDERAHENLREQMTRSIRDSSENNLSQGIKYLPFSLSHW